MIGLGDEVSAGKVSEVDPGGLVVHVQDLGYFFGRDWSIQSEQQEEDNGGFFDAAQEHYFMGGED